MKYSIFTAGRSLSERMRCAAAIALIGLSATAQANITVFTEDFEDGLQGWSVSNGIWQAGAPDSGPGSCESETGTQCAGTILDGNYLPNTDSVLESPVVSLPPVIGGDELHLRFRHWFSYSSSDDGRVYVKTLDQSTGQFGAWVAIGTSMVSVSSWSIADIDMTAYAGEIIRLGFSHTAVDYCCNGSSTDVSTGWYVDDVSIEIRTPEFTGDFEDGWVDWSATRGIWQIGVPTSGPGACIAGAQCAATSLGGSYQPNTDSRLVSATFVVPAITDSQEARLRFQHWFSYSSSDSGQVQIQRQDPQTGLFESWENIGTSLVSVSTWTWKDIDISAYAGNTVRIGFLHTAADYCCNGSSTDVSSGWYIDDIRITAITPNFDGSFEYGVDNWSATRGIWQVGTPTGGPGACFTGENCAATTLNSNYQPNTDSRLVSASVTLPASSSGAGLQLRYVDWYSYSSSDYGQVQVRVFDDSTQSYGAWENIGSSVAGTSGIWSQKDADLTPYAGQRVQLAFLHTAVDYCCNGSSTDVSSGWFIDDISIVSDSDGDFVFDDIDNCTEVFNINQRDTNADGYGNVCDGDLNNDGIVNSIDLGLLKNDFFATGDLDADLSGDFAVNTTDLGIMRSRFFLPPGPSGVAP